MTGQQLDPRDEILAAIAWIGVSTVGLSVYVSKNEMPESTLELLLLYVALFVLVPLGLHIIGMVIGAFSWPFIDLLKLLGRTGLRASKTVLSPMYVARDSYISLRQPQKPEMHTEVITEEWDYKCIYYMNARGIEHEIKAYKKKTTDSRLDYVTVDPSNYTLEEFVKVTIGRDGEINSKFKSPTWGHDRDTIEKYDSWHGGTNRVELSCNVDYEYNRWWNKWEPYVRNFEITTLEQDIK